MKCIALQVDSLGTLAVMGNATEFKRAVKQVVDTVSFDKPSTVQIFEANIRVLGGLLSAHLLIEDEQNTFGNLEPDWYTGDLLTMAHDLADRLITAFEVKNDFKEIPSLVQFFFKLRNDFSLIFFCLLFQTHFCCCS